MDAKPTFTETKNPKMIFQLFKLDNKTPPEADLRSISQPGKPVIAKASIIVYNGCNVVYSRRPYFLPGDI